MIRKFVHIFFILIVIINITLSTRFAAYIAGEIVAKYT